MELNAALLCKYVALSCATRCALSSEGFAFFLRSDAPLSCNRPALVLRDNAASTVDACRSAAKYRKCLVSLVCRSATRLCVDAATCRFTGLPPLFN